MHVVWMSDFELHAVIPNWFDFDQSIDRYTKSGRQCATFLRQDLNDWLNANHSNFKIRKVNLNVDHEFDRPFQVEVPVDYKDLDLSL